MLRQLLVLWSFCLIVVAVPLTKEEIAAIKADLDKEVEKLGGTKKSDNDIVEELLKEMKNEDTKREYHSELLESNTAKKEAVVSTPTKEDTDEELYQLLISATSRYADKTKSTQKDSTTSEKKEITSDGESQAAHLLEEIEKQKKAADKDLMYAIVKSFQQSKHRSENEELVHALIENEREIKKNEAAGSVDDLDLDLHMLSKKNVDMSREILETFLASELKKKDDAKEEESKNTQKHSLEESLLQAILDDEVEKRKKESEKNVVSAKESDTKDIQNLLEDVMSDDVIKKTNDKKQDAQKDTTLSLEESLLKAIMNDEAQKKKTAAEHPEKLSKDELRDTNNLLEELINVVERKKKELQLKNMKNVQAEGSTYETDLEKRDTEAVDIHGDDDMSREILETFLASELKKKDDAKEEESKNTQKHLCQDNIAVGKVCGRFKAVCNSSGDPGNFMKQNCPVTCKHCATCKDSAEEKTCRIWKTSQACGMFKDLAQKWCAKTCFDCYHDNHQSVHHGHVAK